MQTPSFIFGGNTGVSTPQELAKRREIVDALIMSSMNRAPQTFGEGLTAIGQAIAGRIQNKKLKGEERAARDTAQGQFSAITGQLMGGGGGYGMPAQMSRPAPDPNSPAGIGDATMRALGKVPSNGTPITQADIVRGMVARGFAPHIGAATAVNAQDESALNPAAQEANPLVAGSRGGGGFMQWTGPRRVALERYAQQRGLPWDNAELQLDFLAQEMRGSESQAGNAILATQTAPDAAKAIVEQFLRPAPQHMNARAGAYTQDPQVLAQLAELAQNPYAPQGQQMIAQQLMQQQLSQMQPPDPMKDIELQKAQLELQQMQQPQMAQAKIEKVGDRLVQINPDGTATEIYAPPASGGANDPYAEREAAAARLGLAPDDPAYQSFVLTGKMPREDQSPLSATDKNAILQADEMVMANTATIDMLNQVLAPDESGTSLNDRAGYGATAGLQSFAARNDPTGIFDDAQGQATTELQNLVLNQALGQLKATFGAAPTEGERKILVDLQASIDKTPAERKAIIERAIAASQKRLEFNQQKAAELRGGTYYKPQGQAQSGIPSGVDPELWDEMTPEERALFQ